MYNVKGGGRRREAEGPEGGRERVGGRLYMRDAEGEGGLLEREREGREGGCLRVLGHREAHEKQARGGPSIHPSADEIGRGGGGLSPLLPHLVFVVSCLCV